MKYYLIAGEASGDLHASRLMRQLRLQDPKAEFRFFGGDAMQGEGGTLVCHYRDLAYMGFVQVALHLRQILGGMKRCKEDIAAYAPDAVILIDYPGFNLDIAKWVKQNMPETKVIYYISPKIWAWKEYRLKNIRRYVDCLLSILPFEVDWFAERGYKVDYVGNPTVDELAPIAAAPFDRSAFCTQHGLNENQSIIAVLPGSRKAEVSGNLPIMLEAVTSLSCHQVVVAGAPGLTPDFYESILSRYRMVPPVRLVFDETYSLLRAAEVAAVTSGTATLETAYLRVPQVVCYQFRGGMPFYRIMKWVLRHIGHVSLVNLILCGIGKQGQEPAVTELLGPFLTPQRLRSELKTLLGDSAPRREMLARYDRMIALLGSPGAPEKAARRILELLGH